MPAWSSSVHEGLISTLIRARKQAGLTQRDVAARLNKPPSFVGKVEKIERNLSVSEFVAWCEAINVEPHTILAGTRSNGSLS